MKRLSLRNKFLNTKCEIYGKACKKQHATDAYSKACLKMELFMKTINYFQPLESVSPKKFIFICFNESLLKMMKISFCFILKALVVLKIFKFLS